MKTLIAAVALAVSSTALAGPYHGHRHHHHRHWHSPPAHHWVAPLIIGGVVGAAIASNRAEAQPSIIMQHQPAPTVIYNIDSVPNLVCPEGRQLTEERGWYKDQMGRAIYGTIYGCK